jgi:2'-5' RNA ligase
VKLPPPPPGQVWLGASLPVPEPLAGELLRARLEYGDSEAVAPHITVIPPAPLPEARVEEAVGRMCRLAAHFAEFRVRVRGTGTFRPVSPVVYAAVVEGFDRCRELEALIRPALGVGGGRFPYHPHVTVLNGCDAATLDRAQRDWKDVDCSFEAVAVAVALYSEDEGWRPLKSLALRARPAEGQAA